MAGLRVGVVHRDRRLPLDAPGAAGPRGRALCRALRRWRRSDVPASAHPRAQAARAGRAAGSAYREPAAGARTFAVPDSSRPGAKVPEQTSGAEREGRAGARGRADRVVDRRERHRVECDAEVADSAPRQTAWMRTFDTTRSAEVGRGPVVGRTTSSVAERTGHAKASDYTGRSWPRRGAPAPSSRGTVRVAYPLELLRRSALSLGPKRRNLSASGGGDSFRRGAIVLGPSRRTTAWPQSNRAVDGSVVALAARSDNPPPGHEPSGINLGINLSETERSPETSNRSSKQYGRWRRVGHAVYGTEGHRFESCRAR